MRTLLFLSTWLWPMALVPAYGGPIGFSDLLGRPRAAATHKVAYGSSPDQFGELWLPAGKGPHPVVILMHGGCWKAELPGVELMAYIAEDLRKGGVAVWNVEYRRLGKPGAGYPGTFLDIANSVDHLRVLKQTYPLDLSHVVAVGHSAGGQLALWAAAQRKWPGRNAAPLPIEMVVTLAGINDLEAYRKGGIMSCGGPSTIDSLIDFTKRPNPYADTSPAAMLPIRAEMVVVSGELDPIVPPRFGKGYARKVIAAGQKVDEFTIAGAGHFELIDPQSAAWAKIKNHLPVKRPKK